VTDLVQHPNGGWYRPRPEKCRTMGHPLTYPHVIVGWTGTGPYWYCLHPNHPDEPSRWTYPAWAYQGPPTHEMGAPDGGVNRAR